MNHASLETIKKNIENEYHTNVVEYSEKSGVNCDKIKEQLKKTSEWLQKKKIDTMLSESETESGTVEDFYYKKPWNKLQEVHKIIKMREFIDMLMCSKEDAYKIKKRLEKMIKDKRLTKKGTVLYDEKNGKVVSIPILKHVNGVYKIKKV